MLPVSLLFKPGTCGRHTPGFLKLFLFGCLYVYVCVYVYVYVYVCVCLRVCVCVSAPETINN